MASNNTARSLAKIESLLAEGEYYEAQQMYRTIYHRLLKKNEPIEAIQTAQTGALTLLKYKQSSSATDLALLMLDAYKISKVPIDNESRARILAIFQAYDPKDPLRNRFMEASFKWTSKNGAGKNGDAQLHHSIGLEFAREGEVQNAQAHFFLGTAESAEQLAVLLFRHAAPEDREYFCIRVVLQYLCLQNMRDANAFYRAFTKLCYQQNPSLRTAQTTVPTSFAQPDTGAATRTIVTSKLPLFNFAIFLLLLTERNSAQLFQTLRRNYQPALQKDPSFDQMLDRIGEIYFGIRPQATAGGRPNMFGNLSNLMRMFTGTTAGTTDAAAAAADDD